MNKTELNRILSKLDPYKIPFDLAVINTADIIPRYMGYSDSYSWGTKDLPGNIKSIVVYLFFTDKAFDYYIRDTFTPRLIYFMKKHFSESTIYDDYKILRKEAAALAGLGKIGRNSLLFSNKFGFNCKIDLFLTEIEFDHYDNAGIDDYHLEYCRNCRDCINSCPMNCSMDFNITDWEECDRFISPQIPTPMKMCRSCITNCRYSNEIHAKNLKEFKQNGLLLF
jgi:hypothetical protein